MLLDEQYETLFTISNEITRIWGKEDMLHIIQDTLKKHLQFNDSYILRYNKTTRTCKPYIYHAEKRRSRNPALKSYLDLEYPVLDDSIESSNYPIVYNVQSLLPYGGDQMAFMDDAGIKEFAVLKLIEGNQLIGLLILLSEKLNSFSKDNLDLLHRISYQISIATANIIANEEIVKREEEKTILLSLSTEIAAVKNKKELSQLLNAKLIHLFSITGFGITLLNEDKKTHSPFVVDANDDLRNDPDFKKVIALNYSVRDGVFNNIIDAEEPVTLYVKDLVCMSEAPAYVNFWQKMGVIQVVGIPVRAGEKKLGCFILLQNPKAFTSLSNNLIKGVCAQISVAISNIIAIEINAKREYEKTILLSLSYEIAALRNRNDLFKMVNAELKDLFLIKEFGIAQINEDKKTYSAFILELEDHIKSLPGYNEITSDKYDVNDPVFSRIMKSDEPVLFPVNELAEVAGIPAYVGFWKKAGVHEVLCVALKAGGANIGCAFLHTSEQTMNNLNNNLLKGVCAHLSVAVSNILTNEKNSNQLIEINRYKQQLEAEKTYLKAEIETIQNYAEIIGGGPEMKKVFRLVSQVASSSSSVLLLGETGTGKELIARAIHNSSPRKNKLMVKVNCAALPANLIESELFGHERGSFTGATERRLGKFELANNGTLFLDEIGEMPLELQVKLLRAIQEREIERVGGSVTIKVDVRIITATNRDLEKLMEEGKFRNDLYYRLNIFPISLPPLRNRREDIPALAEHFIMRFSKKSGKNFTAISNKVLQELIEYNWPGNIREMEHLIERSVLLAQGDTINEILLPPKKNKSTSTSAAPAFKITTIDENEKEHILNILKYCKGRITGEGGAAALLGVPPSTLNSKIKRLGIKKEFFS